ncbi:hypothetical protein MBLNU459_g1696t1 [Dothideomycetes sp. NU459]
MPSSLLDISPSLMFSPSLSSTVTLAAGLSLLFLAVCMFYPASLLRWLQRKRYQYEVTFSLYMMTPTEKFIFNSVLFLFLSMVTIAASLYLPEHIAIIARRAYYYIAGDFEVTSQRLTQTAVKTAAALSSGAPTVVKDAVETLRDAVSASHIPEL